MPDAPQETAFVDAFILPEKRARCQSFLTNPKRRRKILGRLNHVLDYIPEFAHQIPGGQHNVDGIARLLNDRGVKDTDTLYVISCLRALDGQEYPLRQALELVHEEQSGSVVCCIPGRLAYYRPESPENGYILQRPERPEPPPR